VKNIAQDLVGPLVGIDVGDDFGAVEIEDGFGFFRVDFQAAFDDFVIDVVEAIFLQRAAFQAVVDFGFVGAGEMEDAADIQFRFEHFGLVEIARDAVEDEKIDLGFEPASPFHAFDLRGPEPDGDIVGDKLAFAGIAEEGLAEIGTNVDGAENIAAGAVIEAGNGAENFALGAFAGAGRAKKEKRFIGHD